MSMTQIKAIAERLAGRLNDDDQETELIIKGLPKIIEASKYIREVEGDTTIMDEDDGEEEDDYSPTQIEEMETS